MKPSPQDRSRLAVIERTLAAIETERREVFLMHRLESLGYLEIAERLGISVPQVEAHLAAVMFALLQAFDPIEPVE